MQAQQRRQKAGLSVSSAQSVRGTQTVVLGAFNVGFTFQSIDNTKATGGMIRAFGGTTRAKNVLEGVTPEMMQKITDAAYEDFKQQLAAKGLIVADAGALFASEDFERAKPLAVPYDAKAQLD